MAALRNLSAAGVSCPPLTRPRRAKVRRATRSHSSTETPAPNNAIARCSSGSRSVHETPSITHLKVDPSHDDGVQEVKTLQKRLLPLPYSLVAPPIRSKCKFVSWDKRFVDPIAVPGRKPLVTLHDAATYITKLPKAEHDAEEWQAPMQA